MADGSITWLIGLATSETILDRDGLLSGMPVLLLFVLAILANNPRLIVVIQKSAAIHAMHLSSSLFHQNVFEAPGHEPGRIISNNGS